MKKQKNKREVIELNPIPTERPVHSRIKQTARKSTCPFRIGQVNKRDKDADCDDYLNYKQL